MSQRLRSQWNGVSRSVDVAVQLVQLAHDRLERLDLLPALALLDGRLGSGIGPDTPAVILGVSGQSGGPDGRRQRGRHGPGHGSLHAAHRTAIREVRGTVLR